MLGCGELLSVLGLVVALQYRHDVFPPDASLGLVVALQGGVVLHRASMPCLVIQERPRALVRHVNFGRPGLKPSQDAPAASFIVPQSVG